MSLKETLDWLATNGYLVYVNNSPILTAKLYQELGIINLQSGPTETVEAPKKKKKDDPGKSREIWDKFVEDSKIPWRVTTNGQTYTVCSFSVAAVNKLISILDDPEVDNEIFIKSVQNYYNSVTFAKTIKNYLIDDVWKFEYNQFKKNGKGSTNIVRRDSDGSSKFED